MKRVGVIDIGSNSIKLLVADATGAVLERTLETRISSGITGHPPMLSDAALAAGAEAVASLYDLAMQEGASTCRIVATSAVRDAANRQAFADWIEAKTGATLDILSGDEEAVLIAKGIVQDPAMAGCNNFILADLGGGSMEVMQIRNGQVEAAKSLQVGAVRFNEKFVANPAQCLLPDEMQAIREATREALATLPFSNSEAAAQLVLTGGVVTFTRKLISGEILFHTGACLPISKLNALAEAMAPLDIEARISRYGLPRNRADILPTGLVILTTLADHYGFTEARHSLFNLRFGAAKELL